MLTEWIFIKRAITLIGWTLFNLLYLAAPARALPSLDSLPPVNPAIDSILRLLPDAKDSTRVKVLNALAFHLYNSRPDQAQVYAQQALQLGQSLPYPKGVAQSLRRLGFCQEVNGKHEQALSYYLQALHINERIAFPMGVASNSNDMGDVYCRMNQPLEALSCYERSLAICESLPDSNGIGITLNNIGFAYRLLKQYTQALEKHEKALTFLSDDPEGIATSWYNMGMIYQAQKEYATAETYYLRALPILEKIDDKENIALVLANLGAMYTQQGRYEMAYEHLQKALTLAKEIKARQWEIACYAYLSEWYSRQERYEEALQYYQKYASLKASVFTIESSRTVSQLKSNYELGKKQAHIELLTKDGLLQTKQLQQQQIMGVAALAGLALVILLAFSLYRGMKKERHTNRLLSEKNQEISHQKEEMTVQSEQLKQANEQLERINGNLENIVEERTRELLQKNKQLIEYAYVNAHKVRGPLASIMGLVNLIKEGEDYQPELLSHLKTCTHRLDNVIHEINDLLQKPPTSPQ